MGDPTAECIEQIASRVCRGQLRPSDIRHRDHAAMARPAALDLVGCIALEARRLTARRASAFGRY